MLKIPEKTPHSLVESQTFWKLKEVFFFKMKKSSLKRTSTHTDTFLAIPLVQISH